MEELEAIKEKYGNEPSDEYLDALVNYMNDGAPEEVSELYDKDDVDNDIVRSWEQLVFENTPYELAENAASREAAEADMKDDPDLTDVADDEPHDADLNGDTTPEEEAMLRLAGSDGDEALPGDTTPEEEAMLKLAGNNVLSDDTQRNIINAISAHRW